MIYCFAFSKFVEITRIISQDSWLFFLKFYKPVSKVAKALSEDCWLFLKLYKKQINSHRETPLITSTNKTRANLNATKSVTYRKGVCRHQNQS